MLRLSLSITYVLTVLLVSPLVHADAGQGATRVSDETYLSVHVFSSPTKVFGRDLDLTQSHVGLDWGNIRPADVVDAELGQGSFRRSDYFFTLSFKFSAVPYLMANSTEDQLNEHLDEIIDQKRAGALALVTSKVNAALRQDVGFGMLPMAQQDVVRSKMVMSSMAAVDQALNDVRAQKRLQNQDRIHQIRAETSFQELAVTFGRVIQDGSSVVFFKFGKFTPELGAPINPSTGSSELEALRAGNSFTQRGSGSAGTGALQLTAIHKLNPNLAVRVDGYLLHERYPWISGEDNIGARASLDQATFDRQKEIFKIDSKAIRALLQHERGDVYATVVDFNGVRAYQTGAVLRVTPETTVFLDHYRGDRKNLSSGTSAFVAYRVTEAVSVFSGVEKVKEAYRPALTSTNDGVSTYRDVVIGIHAILFDRKISVGPGGRLRIESTGEAIQRQMKADPANNKRIYQIAVKLLYAF